MHDLYSSLCFLALLFCFKNQFVMKKEKSRHDRLVKRNSPGKQKSIQILFIVILKNFYYKLVQSLTYTTLNDNKRYKRIHKEDWENDFTSNHWKLDVCCRSRFVFIYNLDRISQVLVIEAVRRPNILKYLTTTYIMITPQSEIIPNMTPKCHLCSSFDLEYTKMS